MSEGGACIRLHVRFSASHSNRIVWLFDMYAFDPSRRYGAQRYPMRAREAALAHACPCCTTLYRQGIRGHAKTVVPYGWGSCNGGKRLHTAACSVFPHGMATALYGFSIRVDSTHASDAVRSVIQCGRESALALRALAVPHFTGKASAGMPKPWCHMAGVRAMAGGVCIRLSLSCLTNMRPLPTRKNGKQPS